MPTTNVDKWVRKFERNAARDRRAEATLTGTGWRVLVVWECETKDLRALEHQLRNWFNLAEIVPKTARHAREIEQ